MENAVCQSSLNEPEEKYEIRFQPRNPSPLQLRRTTTSTISRTDTKMEVTESISESESGTNMGHSFVIPRAITRTDVAVSANGNRTQVASVVQRDGLEKNPMSRELAVVAPASPVVGGLHKLIWQPKEFPIITSGYSCGGISIPTAFQRESRPPSISTVPTRCELNEIAQENGEYVKMIVLYAEDRIVGYSVRKACGRAFGFSAPDNRYLFTRPSDGDAVLLRRLFSF